MNLRISEETWKYFNFAIIFSEAKERLIEFRAHGCELGTEKDTLEYWCAWVAHANLTSIVSEGQLVQQQREK